MDYPIVLSDGVCKFCNFWINFAIRKDAKKQLRFATLQSEIANELMAAHQIDIAHLDSVICIHHDVVYTEMDAVIYISKHLQGIGRSALLLQILSKQLRNKIYKWVAKNRYRFWGRYESCQIPTEDTKSRFLD